MPDEMAHAAETLKSLPQPSSANDARAQEVRDILTARETSALSQVPSRLQREAYSFDL